MFNIKEITRHVGEAKSSEYSWSNFNKKEEVKEGWEEEEEKKNREGSLQREFRTDVQHQSLYPDIFSESQAGNTERRQHLVSLRLLVNLQNQQFKKKIFKVSTKNLSTYKESTFRQTVTCNSNNGSQKTVE